MCVPENSHNSIKPRQSMLCRGESLEGICDQEALSAYSIWCAIGSEMLTAMI